MSMIMFAIIGVVIDAPVFYWICFGIYSTCKVIRFFFELLED